MGITIPVPERIAEIADDFRTQLQNQPASDIAVALVGREGCECISADLLTSITEAVQDKLGNQTSVIVVGSAKLGISLRQLKENGRTRGFLESSDIDLALCNDGLFDQIWEETYSHFLAKNPWHQQQKFQKYFFRGWIRPDMLPHSYPRRNDWFDLFRQISRDTLGSSHSIAAGLYKSRNYLEGYQRVAITGAQTMLELTK